MKVIVMTGATSGIGAEAIKHFAEQPDTLIIVGARGSGREVPEGTEVFPLDLSSLRSVYSFAEAVNQRLGNMPLDLLVLNAGIQLGSNGEKSVDGFELTFATNHLAHYLLARRLWMNMAKGGRLLITTSDTHDPAVFPFAPKTMNPQELAYPAKTSRMRAYASSKLCNLLMARSFAQLSIKEKRGISVIAYNPGLTAGTSLGAQSEAMKELQIAIRPFLNVVSFFKPAFYMGNVEHSGEVLAELVLGKVTMPGNRIYASLVKNKITFPDPSKLAQSDEARDLLWKESAKMVGLLEKI
ncbi:MAG: dehydrogenase [Bacteroidia bacterium 44-10]|jgi:NAD(P)-dependent dehydrogenase (short-subunit alcohol dehydrogenase family)|nr:MAG: dehydrogenase [Bacteroidia bacterium 44-10]